MDAHHLSAHGALMDPDYLRDALADHVVSGKADAVARIALAVILALPLLLWLSSWGA